MEANVNFIQLSKESKYNTIKLAELYSSYSDQLKQLIETQDARAHDIIYDKIIHTYNCAKKFENVDTELHDVMIATCLYQMHAFLVDTDYNLLMDEVGEENNTKLKLNYNKLAEFLIKKYCIISHNDIPYLYIGNQYYSDERRSRLKKDITKVLEALNWSDHTKVSDISKDIVDRIINSTQKIRAYPFNELSNDLIPVINGVVHRHSMRLLPHSPAFRMLYCLNAEFKPDMDPKIVNDYLNSLVEVKEDADLLLQIPSQALLQNPQYQLAYTLTGDGSNGKSIFIGFLQFFIGQRNYTAISLHTLTENRFACASLEGKLLNLYPDLEKQAVKYLGIFKALTGADNIQVERKFGAPFSLKNKAVFCFSANELPEVSDATYAFWRRICVIPFPNKFGPDPFFVQKLHTPDNMSAFLNLVINKMNRIEAQGLTRSNRVEEACKLWKARSSSAYAFVQDCIVKDSNGKIIKSVMESLYRAYCDEKDITMQDFKNVVNELHKLNIITARARNDQQLVYVYHGCKYVRPEVKYIKDEPVEGEAPVIFEEE